jgi:hypothetical protein
MNKGVCHLGENRKGNQKPTKSIVLPYKETLGEQAIDVYNSSGREAQQWQELLIYDMLAINKDKLWVHTKFGYSVPRRNGKNEVVIMREMWGLTKGERILHTAHRQPPVRRHINYTFTFLNFQPLLELPFSKRQMWYRLAYRL